MKSDNYGREKQQRDTNERARSKEWNHQEDLPLEEHTEELQGIKKNDEFCMKSHHC